MLQIKKRNIDAIAPTKAHDDDAGFDLYCIKDFTLYAYYNQDQFGIPPMKIPTGISIWFPRNHFAMIKERSSLAAKGVKLLGGVIDYGYTGEIFVVAYNFGNLHLTFSRGDKIAQMVILPIFNAAIEIVTELPPSERGDGGFGSSDPKLKKLNWGGKKDGTN